MRVYYLFKVNNYFYYMYKNKPFKMYKMLEEIYHTRNNDVVLTYRMFEQIASPFNKSKVNEYVNNYLKNNNYYMRSNNIHLISNNLEYSKLSVANSNLKIKTNINYTSFFDILNNYTDNVFICDFINKDYFWLQNISKKDRQKHIYLVK